VKGLATTGTMQHTIISNEYRHAAQLYQRGNLVEAEKACRGLLQRVPAQSQTLLLLVSILANQGRKSDALKFLKKESRKFRKDADVLNTIGAALKHIGMLDEARLLFQQALRVDRNNAHAAFNLGTIHATHNRLQEAKKCYQQAIANMPTHYDAMGSLAAIALVEDDAGTAIKLCDNVIAALPNHVVANITLAKAYTSVKEYQKVIDLLQPLLGRGVLEPVHTAVAYEKMAKAQERLGEYKAAFESFTACNEIIYCDAYPKLGQDVSAYEPDSIARIHRYFLQHDVSCWPLAPPEDAYPAPVFLVGFPRSGTTLLDQMLTSHKAVFTLEEQENLVDIYREFALSDAGLEKLDDLDETAIRRFRKMYWSHVLPNVSKQRHAEVIIDKLPLNTIMLGHIYRFFPEARVIFALRDPRDSCLSCFQQNFVPTKAMLPFLKLDTTVAYYDQVMKLGEYFRSHLPLPFFTIRYEDVVSDFRATIEPLIEFLGLEWDDNVANYQETARKRHIRTPSDEQVVKPLYSSSIGKWEAYREFLYPDWALLDEWASRWGYQDACANQVAT
jgi:tetratricopeptide (TPR) repeat protein